jgi:hypothetical protein
MTESRRDLFKLSVIGAVGLSGCASMAREPATGSSGPVASTPTPHDVTNQSDIFVYGTMGTDRTQYWFLLQWDGHNYVAYYTAYVFHGGEGMRPEIVTATSGDYWAPVTADRIVVGVGPDEIPVRGSTVSVDCLRNLLGGRECAMTQHGWNEINHN